MKIFVTTFVALIAYYTTVKSATSTPRIHLYRKILEEPSERVAGGSDAQRHQFPYQASIIWGETSSELTHNCGGTLIAKRWVLTAAHCKERYGEYQIKLGQLKQNEDNDDIQVFEVVQFITHEGFSSDDDVASNDIALIELDRDAELTDAVQIAELANNEECDDISDSVASGWGHTEHGDPIRLQWATLPRITNKDCADALISIIGKSSLDDTMICTGQNLGSPQSICSGDSGGPLVLEKDGSLIGVTSWFIDPCGFKGAPSVFTRICSHREFIKKYVKQ